jgi:hypothetical protein
VVAGTINTASERYVCQHCQKFEYADDVRVPEGLKRSNHRWSFDLSTRLGRKYASQERT